MDWKIFIAALVLNQVTGLPFEICCSAEETADPISEADGNLLVLRDVGKSRAEFFLDDEPPQPDDADEANEAGDVSVFESFQRAIVPAAANPFLDGGGDDGNDDDDDDMAGCDERCCRRKSLKRKNHKSRSSSVMTVVRKKRFPMHLDPLFQYRFLSRSGQCPTAKDGQPEFYCPTPDRLGNWRCIDDFQLCDGVRHCPNGEDELPVSCLFYRVVETHLNSVSQRLNNDEMRMKERKPR